MEVKVFKKQNELDNFIATLDESTFYKLLSSEKSLFRLTSKVLVFSNKDVEEYLLSEFHKILAIFAIEGLQTKVYLNDNRFYLKVVYQQESPLLLKKYGYIISAIQNLLISYLFSKFSK